MRLMVETEQELENEKMAWVAGLGDLLLPAGSQEEISGRALAWVEQPLYHPSFFFCLY